MLSFFKKKIFFIALNVYKLIPKYIFWFYFQYEFEASFLEIYNETIRDLLGDKDDLKHEIKMATDKSNSVHVSNLTMIHVRSRAQVSDWLSKKPSGKLLKNSFSVFRMFSFFF